MRHKYKLYILFLAYNIIKISLIYIKNLESLVIYRLFLTYIYFFVLIGLQAYAL